METRRLRANIYRIAMPGLLAVGLWACSTKSSSVADVRGSNTAGEAGGQTNSDDSGQSRGKPESGYTDVLEGGAGSDLAQNSPQEPDETITPPINQTGSPGDKTDSDQLVLNGLYFIKSAGGMKCLAIPDNSKENGVQVHQMGCDLKSNAMKFEIEYLPSEKAYAISNVANGKFLEVRDQSEVVQGAVQQNDYFGLKHQMFLIELKEEGRYHIRTKTKKLFFDVTGASIADRALIQLWGDGQGISSVWILEPTL